MYLFLESKRPGWTLREHLGARTRTSVPFLEERVLRVTTELTKEGEPKNTREEGLVSCRDRRVSSLQDRPCSVRPSIEY